MNRFIQLRSQLRKRHTLLHTGGEAVAFRNVSILIGQRQGTHPTFLFPPPTHTLGCLLQAEVLGKWSLAPNCPS